MKKFSSWIIMGILCFFVVPFLVNAQGLITSLNVDGIGNLDASKKSFALKLTTTLDYATITATPANENVTIEGVGKVPIVEGKNVLVVKATDGTTTEEYTINLSMNRPSGDATDGNPNTGEFVSFGLLLLGLGVAITAYLISRKKRIYQI